MELNDVFKANNYAGRKKVLDRFPLSKEDKDNVNKSIEKLSNTNGGGNDGAFTYKSRKVVWDVDNNNEQLVAILPIIMFLPFYCVSTPSDYKIIKYYGITANTFLGMQISNIQLGGNGSIAYIEECECNCIINTPFGNINCNGSLIDYFKKFGELTEPDSNPSDEEIIHLLSSIGITQTSYDDYINAGVQNEYGCLTL